MAENGTSYPISRQQRRLLETARRDTARCVVLVNSPVVPDAETVQERLNQAIVDHAVLRSAFPYIAGRRTGVQVPQHVDSVALEVVRVRSGACRVEALRAATDIELDVESGRVLGAVLSIGPDGCCLVLVASPLVADASSLATIATSALRTDGSAAAEASDSVVPYLGYASWQQEEEPDSLGLTAPAAVHSRHVQLPLVRRVSLASRRAHAPAWTVSRHWFETRFDSKVVLAAWAAFLARATRSSHLQLWVSVPGRNLDGLENSIGRYDALLPLQVSVGDDKSVHALAERLSAEMDVLRSRVHRFEDPSRPHGGRLEVRPAFGFVEDVVAGEREDGVMVEVLSFGEPCTLVLRTRPVSGRIDLMFDGSITSGPYAEQLVRQFADFLAQPGGWLTTAGTRVETPSVTGQFLACADTNPGGEALVSSTGAMTTFADLAMQAKGLASYLVHVGAKEGSRVLLLDSGRDGCVRGLIAASMIGAHAIPISLGVTNSRLREAMEGVDVVIASDPHSLPPRMSGVPVVSETAVASESILQSERAPGDWALKDSVIFNSAVNRHGGRAVPVSGAALAHQVDVLRKAIGIGPADRTVLSAASGSTAAYRQSMLALSVGASVLLPARGEQDLASMLLSVCTNGVTVLELEPAAWLEAQAAVEADADLRGALKNSKLRCLIAYGQPMTEPTLAAMKSVGPAGSRLVHTYTVTEAGGVVASLEVCAQDDQRMIQPVGRSIPPCTVRLISKDGCDAPTGIPGEIWIGVPELNATRTVPTGDVGMFDVDGLLHILGRRDDQVQIDGFPVSLMESEVAVAGHPAVAEAQVVAVPNDVGVELHAYFVARRDQRPTGVDLRSFLIERMPGYAVPTTFQQVHALPRAQWAWQDPGAEREREMAVDAVQGQS